MGFAFFSPTICHALVNTTFSMIKGTFESHNSRLTRLQQKFQVVK